MKEGVFEPLFVGFTVFFCIYSGSWNIFRGYWGMPVCNKFYKLYHFHLHNSLLIVVPVSSLENGCLSNCDLCKATQ